MKLNLISIRSSLAIVTVLACSVVSSPAQDVLVTGTLTDVPGSLGVFDYTLTLHNTGSEAVQALWLGWTVGNFNIPNPTDAGNNLAWANNLDGDSIQYGSGTPIASGGTGIFTFDSTASPTQIAAMNGWASVAYGVDATPFAIENTTLHSDEFTPSLGTTPEPSTFSLLVIGALGFSTTFCRKFRSH
jgi:hypothetical protein